MLYMILGNNYPLSLFMKNESTTIYSHCITLNVYDISFVFDSQNIYYIFPFIFIVILYAKEITLHIKLWFTDIGATQLYPPCIIVSPCMYA